jgi:hypothetical protein
MPFAKVAVMDVAVTASPSILKLIDPFGADGDPFGADGVVGDVGVLPPPPHAVVTTNTGSANSIKWRIAFLIANVSGARRGYRHAARNLGSPCIAQNARLNRHGRTETPAPAAIHLGRAGSVDRPERAGPFVQRDL